MPSGETEIEGISEQAKILIAASTMFPGFRFSPTDVELISFYLQKKVEGSDKRVEVISEVDMYGYEPWDLPGWFVASLGTYITLLFLSFFVCFVKQPRFVFTW